jgi:hypothetical protein
MASSKPCPVVPSRCLIPTCRPPFASEAIGRAATCSDDARRATWPSPDAYAPTPAACHKSSIGRSTTRMTRRLGTEVATSIPQYLSIASSVTLNDTEDSTALERVGNEVPLPDLIERAGGAGGGAGEWVRGA